MTNTPPLRSQLAEARIALRDAKDAAEQSESIATYFAQPVGKNAEERKADLAYKLSQDADYQTTLTQLRLAEADYDRIAAQVAIADEEQTAARLATVNRLADALTALANRRAADSIIVEAALPDDWYKK